jgi:hypothetical protein
MGQRKGALLLGHPVTCPAHWAARMLATLSAAMWKKCFSRGPTQRNPGIYVRGKRHVRIPGLYLLEFMNRTRSPDEGKVHNVDAWDCCLRGNIGALRALDEVKGASFHVACGDAHGRRVTPKQQLKSCSCGGNCSCRLSDCSMWKKEWRCLRPKQRHPSHLRNRRYRPVDETSCPRGPTSSWLRLPPPPTPNSSYCVKWTERQTAWAGGQRNFARPQMSLVKYQPPNSKLPVSLVTVQKIRQEVRK